MRSANLPLFTTLQERDLRLDIFRGNLQSVYCAVVIAEADGIISGLERAAELAGGLKLNFDALVAVGDPVGKGAAVCRIAGDPVSLLKGEEAILGALSKSSGIASAASRARKAAAGHFRIVCGATKKMPPDLKMTIRKAVTDAGIDMRMAHQPFVYLDKNYVRIFGSLQKTLEAVVPLNRPIVIQVRGETGPIGQEAVKVAQQGVAVIMVDTGRLNDLEAVSNELRDAGLRDRVDLAFAGNLKPDDLSGLIGRDLDAVDIGYGIVDAPCLPMRFDVQAGLAGVCDGISTP